GDPRPAARESGAAVPLPRQGQRRHDRPLAGRRGHQGRPHQRGDRLADLAGHPHLLPDRLPEPVPRAQPLVLQLRHARPRRAADRRPRPPQVKVLRDRSAGASPRVTTMELFFDLVYVFAVTQLSHRLLDHLTVHGALETLVLFLAVWWSWNYTAWAT